MPTPKTHPDPNSIALAGTAAEVFGARYGARPAGIWAAPGRVNLIGEHTDYNDGYVMPFALPYYTVAAAAEAETDQWAVHSTAGDGQTIHFDNLEGVEGWAAYVAGVAWAMNQAGYSVRPTRIAIHSDVPTGASLSSSAALECSVLLALADLYGHDITREEAAKICRRAENEYVGVPTGILDQSASLMCEQDAVMMMDCRDLTRTQVPFRLEEAGLTMLVVDTNAPHRLVDSEYAARRADCEAAARLLGVTSLRDAADDARLDDERLNRRLRHVLTENRRVLETAEVLTGGSASGEDSTGRSASGEDSTGGSASGEDSTGGSASGIGGLLTASHVSMRDDYEISSVELDSAVDAALGAGALGARMTGGGFGGSAIALVETESAPQVEAAVLEAAATAGLPTPRVFTARAAAGAHRVR